MVPIGKKTAGCGQEVNCGKAAREATLECPALRYIVTIVVHALKILVECLV